MLYDSVESAYFLQDDPSIDEETKEFRRLIYLKTGETLEIEWMGCEWVFGDAELETGFPIKKHPDDKKIEKIRVCKITPVKKTEYKSSYLELYVGWIHSGDIPWRRDDTRNDVRIIPIKGKIKSKVNFDELFSKFIVDTDEVEKPEIEVNKDLLN